MVGEMFVDRWYWWYSPWYFGKVGRLSGSDTLRMLRYVHHQPAAMCLRGTTYVHGVWQARVRKRERYGCLAYDI